MESYGEILRARREEKDLTYEQIERETTITRQYIEALEAEKVEQFPGEAYFIGFLKNYCEYLDLDSEELIRLYHAKKIQESPVPEGLYEKKSKKPLIISIVVAVAAVLIAVALVLILVVFKLPQKYEEKKQSLIETEKVHQYTFSGRPENKRLYVGDQILIPSSDGKTHIPLTVSRTADVFEIQTPVGAQIIELSEDRELDVDGDGLPDLNVYLSDVTSDSAYGAEVRIFHKNEDLIVKEETETKTDMEEIAVTEHSSAVKRTVIHEDYRAYPFTVNITFRGNCLFRYKVDRQAYSEEYFKKEDVINVTANNGIRLWMSNINALKVHVIAGLQTYELEVGKAGQVKVEDIKWVRDPDGKYRLVILEVD